MITTKIAILSGTETNCIKNQTPHTEDCCQHLSYSSWDGNGPIDIAVFILWSRLGTPLSVKFHKEDGSIYQSGTEYEFDLMMKLHNEHNQPSRILTYVKQNDDYPKNLNWQELRETIRQKECLECFLKEYFRDEETNSNYAYRQFGKNISFEQMFRTHITNTIKDIIGEIEELKEWNGNPYVGLNSFEYDQQTHGITTKKKVGAKTGTYTNFHYLRKRGLSEIV